MSKINWHRQWQLLFGRSLWVFVFSSLCLAYYYQAAYSRNVEMQALLVRFQKMSREKELSIQFRDELKLRLQSEQDPAWVELVLMRELGVVPEGWTKIHFVKQPSVENQRELE